ncbi:hypothetical protein KC220_28030, partial [Mycobacterium tuberculosis]|nr:hypothetical protein [Mycobacterium tuberculosis]
ESISQWGSLRLSSAGSLMMARGDLGARRREVARPRPGDDAARVRHTDSDALARAGAALFAQSAVE